MSVILESICCFKHTVRFSFSDGTSATAYSGVRFVDSEQSISAEFCVGDEEKYVIPRDFLDQTLSRVDSEQSHAFILFESKAKIELMRVGSEREVGLVSGRDGPRVII